jgi:hypothetical protein
MTDEDMHAFTPAHQPRPPAPLRLWPWLLAGLLLAWLLLQPRRAARMQA